MEHTHTCLTAILMSDIKSYNKIGLSQLDTCQVDHVSSWLHGQLDTSLLIWKKVKCNVKIKGEEHYIK